MNKGGTPITDPESIQVGARVTFVRDKGERATVIARPGKPEHLGDRYYQALSIGEWLRRGWRLVRVQAPSDSGTP